ncbi:MAG: hypothetical protein RIS92_3181, partial [Verrucomicrobiota bacterium]
LAGAGDLVSGDVGLFCAGGEFFGDLFEGRDGGPVEEEDGDIDADEDDSGADEDHLQGSLLADGGGGLILFGLGFSEFYHFVDDAPVRVIDF